VAERWIANTLRFCRRIALAIPLFSLYRSEVPRQGSTVPAAIRAGNPKLAGKQQDKVRR